MQLWIGATAMPANSCDVTRSIQAGLGASGQPVRYTHTLNVAGTLEGDTQAELAAAEAALQDALTVPYRDIVLRLDSGAASPCALLNAGSISGVRVSGLTFANDHGGAEYATLRSFRFTATADYLPAYLGGGGDALVRYAESVSITGTGGPLVRYRQAINGPPVKQVVAPRTVVRATQSGRAVGLTGYPKAAVPLWPKYELHDQRVLKKDTPQAGANGHLEWPVTWAYQFEAEANFTGGNPLLPPRA